MARRARRTVKLYRCNECERSTRACSCPVCGEWLADSDLLGAPEGYVALCAQECPEHRFVKVVRLRDPKGQELLHGCVQCSLDAVEADRPAW